jgi:hypothetical protein
MILHRDLKPENGMPYVLFPCLSSS